MHSERAVQSHLTSREVLENPTMDDVTVTLSDEVEHNRWSPRELEESPKGSYERVPHASTDEHNEVQEVSDDTVQDQTYDVVEHFDGSFGSHPVSPVVVVEKTLAAIEHTSNPEEQEIIVFTTTTCPS